MTHPVEIFEPVDPQDGATAAWLDRHFGLPSVDDEQITAGEREAIRARVFGAPAQSSSPRATGVVAGPFAAFPSWGRSSAQRVANLVAAVVLVLILAASLGAALRSDSADELPGAAATASVLPFAPGAALASPAAACVTDATLVLNLAPNADTGALAALPFPVAWYRDGAVSVQRGEEVLRQIDIGDADFLLATSVPGVIQASTFEPGGWHRQFTFLNIATGETLTLGSVREVTVQSGPYVFWTDDDSYTRWSVTDLRTFETVALGERFRTEPLASWRPYVEALTTGAGGPVMLVGTTSFQPLNVTVAPATPFSGALSPLDVSHDAILIDGSLDDIRLIGPRAVASGAMALSPDGSKVAWLGPNDRPGLRFLTLQDVATGEEIGGRPIDATYSNSLMFSADGEFLYATHGTTLERIDLDLADGVTLGNSLIELPNTGYRIAAASPDRTKLLFDRAGSTAEETSLWVDLDSGEIRVLQGQPRPLFTQGIPGISGPVARYVLIDDLQETVSVVDMTTGEAVVTIDRADAEIVTISADGSTVLIPGTDDVVLIDPASGRSITFPKPITGSPAPVPEGTERIPTTFALLPNGACAAGSWDLGNGDIATVLLSHDEGEPIALPDSGVGGWVPAGGP